MSKHEWMRPKVLLEIPFLEPSRIRAVLEAAHPGTPLGALYADVANELPGGAKLVLRVTLEPLLPGLEIDWSRSVTWPLTGDKLTRHERKMLGRALGLSPATLDELDRDEWMQQLARQTRPKP